MDNRDIAKRLIYKLGVFNKIQIIKELRDKTNLGLLQAKELVEDIIRVKDFYNEGEGITNTLLTIIPPNGDSLEMHIEGNVRILNKQEIGTFIYNKDEILISIIPTTFSYFIHRTSESE